MSKLPLLPIRNKWRSCGNLTAGNDHMKKLSFHSFTAIFALLAGLTLGTPVSGEIYLLDFDEHNAEFQMLEAINTIRYQYGIPLVDLDEEVSLISKRHAMDMASRDYFDHFSPDGESPDDRMQSAGLSYHVYENIGIIRTFGKDMSDVVDALMQGFMESPQHMRNILDPNITHVGIGFFQDLDGQNHTFDDGYNPGSIYRGFGTVLVVQDFYQRRVSVVEPSPFTGFTMPGEFVEMKFAFSEKIGDAFIRVTSWDNSLEPFDIPLHREKRDYKARFAIEKEGQYTLSIYANSPGEDWFYREQGTFDLTVWAISL